MFKFIALAALSLAASSASALVVPRSTPPAGWSTDLLEVCLYSILPAHQLILFLIVLQPYDTYHARYMALQCNLKHNTPFFDSCCHPLLVSTSAYCYVISSSLFHLL